MKLKEILTEGLNRQQAEKIIHKFLEFVKDELELNKLPSVNLITNNDYSLKYKSFGGYNPNDKSIHVVIYIRHIQDILRSTAHELTHYKQDLNGELKHDSGEDGSPQENEANSTAAVLMRKWGRQHPSLFGYSSVE